MQKVLSLHQHQGWHPNRLQIALVNTFEEYSNRTALNDLNTIATISIFTYACCLRWIETAIHFCCTMATRILSTVVLTLTLTLGRWRRRRGMWTRRRTRSWSWREWCWRTWRRHRWAK